MGTKHGQLMRGLKEAGEGDSTFKSFKTFKSFDGIFGARFGRLFPKSTAGQFKHDALVKLANHMVSPFDPPKDGPDDEESGIPALYTYFGQFIDHDITFDPTSSFQKHKDPTATEDFRTPGLRSRQRLWSRSRRSALFVSRRCHFVSIGRPHHAGE